MSDWQRDEPGRSGHPDEDTVDTEVGGGPGSRRRPMLAVDPARLLTAAEVGAVLGRRFRPPDRITGDGAVPLTGIRVCEFRAVDGRAAITVQVFDASGWMGRLVRLFGRRSTAVPGLGEAAWRHRRVIHTIRDGIVLAIAVRGVDRADAAQALPRLAQLALPRLRHALPDAGPA